MIIYCSFYFNLKIVRFFCRTLYKCRLHKETVVIYTFTLICIFFVIIKNFKNKLIIYILRI
jgi:hypothetical protein